jgi:hypothetical protein
MDLFWGKVAWIVAMCSGRSRRSGISRSIASQIEPMLDEFFGDKPTNDPAEIAMLR